jgi:hypothetical protein
MVHEERRERKAALDVSAFGNGFPSSVSSFLCFLNNNNARYRLNVLQFVVFPVEANIDPCSGVHASVRRAIRRFNDTSPILSTQ